ncbi:MAG: acyl--CoA ligase [Eubacteriaceae bacterium]|nr:acyl--CoA ligase [Eubacteriaceae bacterium]
MSENKRKISEEKVWMNIYSDEAKSVTLPKLTIYNYLKEYNKDQLDKSAVHYYGTDISFRELFARVDECADAFAAQGVKKGDIVSFVSVATPESIYAVYALNKIGAVANTIDPRMDIASIRRMILEAGSKVLIVLDIAFPKIKKIMDDINQDRIIVQSAYTSLSLVKRTVMQAKTKTDVPYSDVVIKWKEFIKGAKNARAVEAPYVGDALVAITYTGGTTGFPKGVMLTNDSMNAVVINFQYCGIKYEKSHRFLGIIPIFSAYGMVCGMHMPLGLGVTLVPIPNFVPATLGKLVKQFRPNHMISTPAFIEMLIDSPDIKGMDLSFLYTLGSGGDTMNEGLEKKLWKFMEEHNMKYPLAQGYGMSELSAAASFCVGDMYKPSSVGIPSLTTTVSVFDPETGEELGYNEIGEVCVTGPSMMKGYFNRPEETAHVMRKHDDGLVWIHSGDLGYVDEEGFVFIKGRIKRMITRFDGHKVFPINLESMISEHKEVINCAVIGVDDRGHGQGQYPVVFIELRPGVDKKQFCKYMFELCDRDVEERGKPVAVVAIDKIPLTAFGKNDYVTLEKEYKEFDYTKWEEITY